MKRKSSTHSQTSYSHSFSKRAKTERQKFVVPPFKNILGPRFVNLTDNLVLTNIPAGQLSQAGGHNGIDGAIGKVINISNSAQEFYYEVKTLQPLGGGNYEGTFTKLSESQQQLHRVRDAVMRFLQLPDSFWESTHDFFYENQQPRVQGGEQFTPPPSGTIKIACNVTGVSDSFWSEWAIAYHGTEWGNIKSILKDRLRIRGNGKSVKKQTLAKHGEGVYCTPCISTAACYTQPVVLAGKRYNPIMLVRCRPGKLDKPVEPVSNQVVWNSLRLGVPLSALKPPPIWKLPKEEDVKVVALLFVPA